MAFTHASFGPTALGTSVAAILAGDTAPTKTVILKIVLANTNTSTVRAVSLYLEPTTTTGAAADAILSAVPIAPNSTLIINGPITLTSTEDLTAKQDTGTDVTISGSYLTGT